MSISVSLTPHATKSVHDFIAKQTIMQYKKYTMEFALPTDETAEEFIRRHHWERNSINAPLQKPVSPSEILQGSVLYYIDPLEPVALDDWEVLS